MPQSGSGDSLITTYVGGVEVRRRKTAKDLRAFGDQPHVADGVPSPFEREDVEHDRQLGRSLPGAERRGLGVLLEQHLVRRGARRSKCSARD